MRRRSSLTPGLWWLCLAVATCHAAAPDDTDADEPMPVSITATPASVWIGTPVVLSGSSISDGTETAVTLKIKAPGGQGKPAAFVTIHGGLDAEGRYSANFAGTTVAGTYEVEAIAPDGHGTAHSRFRVTDAGTMGLEAGPALTTAAADAGEIVDLLDAKLNAAATVVAFSVSVLSLGINSYVYRLPYKNAQFIFERTANTFDIPLATQGKVLRGKGHFENKRDTESAQAKYSVDIEMCNPGCS